MARAVEIPEKRYLRIGEVADLLGVRPHVLRYWESEFKQIRPLKSRQGQRLYRKKDVETLLLIQGLLRGERYTIAGAKERLEEIACGGGIVSASPGTRDGVGRMEELREGLEDLMLLLDRREKDVGSPE